MQDPKKLFRNSVIGTALVALCCFTPVLVVLLGVVGLSALVGYLDYVLFPALALFIGLTIYAYQRKRRVDHPALTLYRGRRSEGTPRLGFVVSKKVAGKAHDRNRVKRRLRAICLPLLPRLGSCDLILVVRTPALALEFAELQVAVVQLFQQAGVLRDSDSQEGHDER